MDLIEKPPLKEFVELYCLVLMAHQSYAERYGIVYGDVALHWEGHRSGYRALWHESMFLRQPIITADDHLDVPTSQTV